MTDSELQRLANEKALAMLTQQRLDQLEQKVLHHDTVLSIGNGEPALRAEVKRLASEVSGIGEMRKQLDHLCQISDQRAVNEKTAGAWKTKALDKALSSLVNAGTLGVLAWIGWSIKVYLESQ